MSSKIVPKVGDLFKHYKGCVYRVANIAKHTETEEDLVIYHNIKEERLWARPLDMFMGNLEDGTKRFVPMNE